MPCERQLRSAIRASGKTRGPKRTAALGGIVFSGDKPTSETTNVALHLAYHLAVYVAFASLLPAILSDIRAAVLSGILSDIPAGILLSILSGHSTRISGRRGQSPGPPQPTGLGQSLLWSGTAHWHLKLAQGGG